MFVTKSSAMATIDSKEMRTLFRRLFEKKAEWKWNVFVVEEKQAKTTLFRMGPWPLFILTAPTADYKHPVSPNMCALDTAHREAFALSTVGFTKRRYLKKPAGDGAGLTEEEFESVTENSGKIKKAHQAMIFFLAKRECRRITLQQFYDDNFGVNGELHKMIATYARDNNMLITSSVKWGQMEHRVALEYLGKKLKQTYTLSLDFERNTTKDPHGSVLLYDTMGMYELSLKDSLERREDKDVVICRMYDSHTNAWMDVTKTIYVEMNLRLYGLDSLKEYVNHDYETREAVFFAWNVRNTGYYENEKMIHAMMRGAVVHQFGLKDINEDQLMSVVDSVHHGQFLQLTTERSLPLQARMDEFLSKATPHTPVSLAKIDKLYALVAEKSQMVWKRKKRGDHIIIMLDKLEVYDLAPKDASFTPSDVKLVPAGAKYYKLRLIDRDMVRAYLMNTIAVSGTWLDVLERYKELFLRDLPLCIQEIADPVLTAESWPQTVVMEFLDDVTFLCSKTKGDVDAVTLAGSTLRYHIEILMREVKPSTISDTTSTWGLSKSNRRFYVQRPKNSAALDLQNTAIAEAMLRANTILPGDSTQLTEFPSYQVGWKTVVNNVTHSSEIMQDALDQVFDGIELTEEQEAQVGF